MKRALIIHVDESVSDDALEFSGKNIPEELAARLKKISDICIYSVPESYRGKLTGRAETLVRTGDDIACFKALAEKADADSLIRIYADAPFIDYAVIEDMCSVHEKYLAEFTYSENLPSGLSCEIFSKELILALPDADEKRLPLSQVIKSNINQFDVELYYRAPDIRDKRLHFRSGNPREKKIMEALYSAKGSFPTYDELKDLIEKNCEALYAGPSYVEIELTGKAEIETIYSWRKGLAAQRDDIDKTLFKKLLSDMRSFGLPYTVCLGGAGDPMLHPAFYELLDLLRAENLVSSIIIETDGVKAGNDFCHYIEKANDKRIIVIVEMNGYNSETYKMIHGSDRFEEVQQNILSLIAAFGDNSKNLYVQLMKINETEPFIDEFYDMWEPKKVQILLQKQNICLGKIEDRRYYDLTPLDRVPCWHLQRDFFIMSDGKIGFCKQDINGLYSKWDANKSSLEEIWKAKKETFINDYHGRRATAPDCAKCDEWYTFNM